MPSTFSFDVTSPVDFQEVDNALNQARKEVSQRYDFKGAKVDIALDLTAKTLTLGAEDEFKIKALWEIVETKLVKRGVPLFMNSLAGPWLKTSVFMPRTKQT